MGISAFVVAIALLTTGLASAEETSWVPISVDSNGTVIVPVVINGEGPFPFLLDTGSAHSVISATLAERLTLPVVAKTQAVTSTGQQWRPVVRWDSAAIGTKRANGILASVTPPSRLRELARGAEGIVGQDVLFGLNYTLDYRARRLVWAALTATHAATITLPLIEREGRYLVDVGGEADGRAVLLVPDSGADRLVIFERDGRTAIPVEPASMAMDVHTLAGQRAVKGGFIRTLRVGDAVLRNQHAAIVPRAADDVSSGDGLLPLHLFASVTFDARERCLRLRR